MSQPKPKRILLLGASWIQIPPIKYAKSKGYHVITCDNRPENPGHAFADESFLVSTTDNAGVTTLARELKVDGVLAYASDPSVLAAAVAANELGLPGNPPESVEILTHKNQYRAFLKKNDFIVPEFHECRSLDDARRLLPELNLPVIVKPVDSSGSKGVNRVENAEKLEKAFEIALSFSRCKTVIMEEVVVRVGHQITGDGFIVDGQLAFLCLSNEHYNNRLSSIVPVGESFPWRSETNRSTDTMRGKICAEIEKLIQLLNMKTGAFNVEVRIGHNDEVHLLEFGPRNGGNWMPEAIRESTGVDLIAHSVEAALGAKNAEFKQTKPNLAIATYMLHAEEAGVFSRVRISEDLKAEILAQTVLVKPGQEVLKFTGSHATLGGLLLRFPTAEEMVSKMDRMRDFVSIECEPTK